MAASAEHVKVLLDRQTQLGVLLVTEIAGGSPGVVQEVVVAGGAPDSRVLVMVEVYLQQWALAYGVCTQLA